MNQINLTSADYIIVFVYLIGTLLVGLFYARNSKKDNIDNFLLAGRRLSLPAFTATLVSTWYGGILGIGEFTWLYGILNWVTQALPYYVFAIIFAFFFAPKIQQKKLYTIPDLLYENYGKSTGLFGSILIFLLVSPAPHLLMVMMLLSSIFGISLFYAYFIAILFSVFYVFWGGFQSVVKTDIIQFVLMFVGFVILLIHLIIKYGGFTFLANNLPSTHLSFTGGQEIQYIFVWFFIALWTFVDPGFYQRCYAAKTPNTAKYGILTAIGFWIIFDMLTTIAGLYSRAIFANINPVMAFPRLGEVVLPGFFRGFFIVGLLATIMSTLDSTSFLAAVSFGRDILWRLNTKGNINRFTRIGLIVSIIFSTLLILLIPSVVTMWYTLGSLFIPALLLPVIIVFVDKQNNIDLPIFFSMILTFTGTSLWFILGVIRGSFHNPLYIQNIQPFYIGIAISIITFSYGFKIKK